MNSEVFLPKGPSELFRNGIVGIKDVEMNDFKTFSVKLNTVIPFEGYVKVTNMFSDSKFIKVDNMPVKGVQTSGSFYIDLPIID